jgi:predicted TIM-barrel fold metal-dependent hydrolase
MFETDYPHSDTTFPRSREVAGRVLEGVPADEARRMLRDNAVRFFGLDAAA